MRSLAGAGWALWALCALARGEAVPLPTNADARIQTVRFTGEEVIRVTGAEGVVTTLELAQGEQIKDFAMGDREAWHAAVQGNLFVFKPKEVRADTNLTLFTDRRAYLFQLRVAARGARQVAYWVRLQYPEQEAGTPEAVAARLAAAQRRQVREDLAAVAREGALNHDYWIVGPRELQPLAMHDNGRQTFMRFSAAEPLPAAFVIEADGSESLFDYHVEGDTMVLHRVVRRVLLRRGAMVAGITNRSLAVPTDSAATGTASTRVERALRAPGF